MTNHIRFAILGAGHGGKAMAADLALKGFHVTLYNRTWEHIEGIRALGGIDLEGPQGPMGFGALALATANVKDAINDADCIMVVVPATAHCYLAEQCAPHLRDGQIIVLNPGRTGGALEFVKTLRENGCTADVIVAETQTLIFASRSMGPAQAKIFRRKNAVPIAALPATRTPEVLEVLREAYTQFMPAETVLKTSMDNMGAIFHPALAALNAGRIESTVGQFQFYIEGVTPSVARVLETLDRERVTVAAALGVNAISARDWLEMAYNAIGTSLHEAIHNNPGYRGIMAPQTLEHRYIFEDVPMSLVPISELGRAYGVSTPLMDAVIRLASTIHGTDYRHRGRTVEKMGLSGMSVGEIKQYVKEGTP